MRGSDRGWRQLHNEGFRNLHFTPNIPLLVWVPKTGGGAKDLPLPLNFGKQQKFKKYQILIPKVESMFSNKSFFPS
jgi:hypothetical protein